MSNKDLKTAIEIYEGVAECIDKKDYGEALFRLGNALLYLKNINPSSSEYNNTIGARVLSFVSDTNILYVKLGKAISCLVVKGIVDDEIDCSIKFFKQVIDERAPFIKFHLDGLEEKVTE